MKAFKKLALLTSLAGTLIVSMLSFASISNNKLDASNVTKATNPTLRMSVPTATLGSKTDGLISLYDTKNIGSLSFDIYFDPTEVEISELKVKVTNSMNDITLHNDHFSASFIFNKEHQELSYLEMISFKYTLYERPKHGTSKLDMIIKESYDSSLNLMDVNSVDDYIYVNEPGSNKVEFVLNCSEFSGHQLTYGAEDEFSFTSDAYNICSGSIDITYDPTVIDVFEINKGHFLKAGIVDIYKPSTGLVKISFVRSIPYQDNDWFTLRFRVASKIETETKLNIKVTEAYDTDYNLYVTNEITKDLYISKVFVSPTREIKVFNEVINVNEENQTVELGAKIEKNSNLGAGDFLITFDTNIYTFVSMNRSYPYGLIPINTSEANNGKVRFGVIETDGILEETYLVTYILKYNSYCDHITGEITISASDCTEPMGEELACFLKYLYWEVPITHDIKEYKVIVEVSYIRDGEKVGICSKCHKEIKKTTPRFLNDQEYIELLDYAEKFLKARVCGMNDYTAADSNIFLTLRDDYNNLSLKCKEALMNLTSDSDTTAHIVEQVLAKYDRIIMLHGDNANLYPDFMERSDKDSFTYKNQVKNNLIHDESNMILIVTFILSIIFSSLFILLKIKRERN